MPKNHDGRSRKLEDETGGFEEAEFAESAFRVRRLRCLKLHGYLYAAHSVAIGCDETRIVNTMLRVQAVNRYDTLSGEYVVARKTAGHS